MNELELKIKCIVKDALHLLNNKNVTNYSEGEICNYVYYYIEQYVELKEEIKGLSFKEAEYYLLNKAGRIPEIDLWIKEE